MATVATTQQSHIRWELLPLTPPFYQDTETQHQWHDAFRSLIKVGIKFNIRSFFQMLTFYTVWSHSESTRPTPPDLQEQLQLIESFLKYFKPPSAT